MWQCIADTISVAIRAALSVWLFLLIVNHRPPRW